MKAAFPTITHGCTATVLVMGLAVSPALAQRTAEPDAPAGWVGISLIQNGSADAATGISMNYPVIASVEPGSPAKSAGLTAGDTILAYNGTDAREDPLAMRRFLRPGQRMLVKVRRNGVRDVAVTVARRAAQNRYSVDVQVNGAGSFVPPLMQIGPSAPMSPRRAAPLVGAQLARVNAGLASVLNVRDMGVLVVDVIAGTPAMRSGLRSGDVIVRADSLAVLGPLELMRAVRLAADRSIALDVLRKGRTQKVTLRW